MQTRTITPVFAALSLVAALSAMAGEATAQQPSGWKQHEVNRPQPPVVTPPPQSLPAPPPADAVVLFDGRDLSAWRSSRGGGPAEWTVANGHFVVAPGKGPIRTREAFGDVQLHVEWASPNPPTGTSQGRGNSGVFLMGRYEIQVLDNYQAQTYPDGQAGAIYGQYPPLANASRAPGEWQAYDIYFRRPRFDANGKLLERARVTVVHNGVVVQNNEEILGQTTYMQYSPYQAHLPEEPLELQDHGDLVRFRNIWVRRLPERPAPPAGYMPRSVQMTTAQMDRYVGSYMRGQQTTGNPLVRITRRGSQLYADIGTYSPQLLTPVSPTEFALAHTGGRLVFELDAQGRPTTVTFEMGGGRNTGRRVP